MCSIFSRIHIQISHKILLDIFFSTYTRNTSHTFFYLIIITSIERYRENRNREHHGKRSDTRPDQVANRIILPSSFQGRAINKGQNLHDAMMAWHLDLIVSFTCNNVEEGDGTMFQKQLMRHNKTTLHCWGNVSSNDLISFKHVTNKLFTCRLTNVILM